MQLVDDEFGGQFPGAFQQSLSDSTVKTHVGHILGQAQSPRLLQAVVEAYESG
jgi:hypothetical protein